MDRESVNAGDLGNRGRHHAVNVVRPARHYLYRLGPGIGERRYRRRRCFSDVLGRPKGSVGDSIGVGPLDEETLCH